MAPFLVIHRCTDQEKNEKHGKKENGEAAIIAYAVSGMGCDEKPSQPHDDATKSENPVGNVGHYAGSLSVDWSDDVITALARGCNDLLGGVGG